MQPRPRPAGQNNPLTRHGFPPRRKRNIWNPVCLFSIGSRRHSEALAAINIITDRLPPGAIVEIPLHRLAQSGGEGLLWLPAKLRANTRGIDGVTQVVPGTVGDEGDERFTAADRAAGRKVVEQCTDCLHDIEVAALAPAANAIGFAGATAVDDGEQSAGMVFDVKPVAHVAAVAVDRQLLALDTVDDGQGD